MHRRELCLLQACRKITAPKRRFLHSGWLAYFQPTLAFVVDTATDFALSVPARFTALTA